MNHPEKAIVGFACDDGDLVFYSMVNALLGAGMVVLDFGAGRGTQTLEAPPYLRRLRTMKGRVAKVIGIDIDPAVATNPLLDEHHVVKPNGPLPLASQSVDLIL